MKSFDVFNGDADGLCALLQLRQVEPRDSVLVTGVKRDIALLAQVEPSVAQRVCVLDVSLDKNRDALQALLAAGAEVFYCDHHFAGEIPEHPKFDGLINTAPDVCTSLLVNGRLGGARATWAVVGAFGDNLDTSARALARAHDMPARALELYQRLGMYLNYNGYGATLDDLHFHPRDLFQQLYPYDKPEDFADDTRSGTFARLAAGYEEDMQRAAAVRPEWSDDSAALYILPREPWARRVSGVFGNQLANAAPERAHAVLTVKDEGGFLVSVRAPLHDKRDADTLCRQFASGGGRAAAAGINHLPAEDLDRFVAALCQMYGG